MCGRFTRLYTWKQLHRLLSLGTLPSTDLPTSYNVAPSQLSDVCRLSAQGQREVVPMKWGLIPSWFNDGKAGPINARCETVATNAMFRNAFRYRRCLVPASGFYEWRKTGDHKQPFYIRPLNDELFFFAGLWERFGEGDQAIETFTILTTTPNEAVAGIHDRMPVIIRPAEFDAWLGTRTPPAELFTPYPADETAIDPVGSRVGNAKNDDSTLIEPQQESLW
jgi:putative SOS response-associated peptidase YedK